MKILVTIISLIFFLESCSNREFFEREIDFNSNWQFQFEKGDSVDQEIGPLHDNWVQVTLPHYWSDENSIDSIMQSEFKGNLNENAGWYKKSFITQLEENQKLYMLFEKVSGNSVLWINNQKVGEHSCSVAPFYFDITNYLKPIGELNELIVKVKRESSDGKIYGKESGIFSHVKFVKVNKLHIPIWGTEITTPLVSNESAYVYIKIDLINSFNEHKTCDIITEIYDPQNKLVQVISNQSSFVKIGSSVFEQRGRILNPQLWDIDSPNLYCAKTKIFSNKKIVDTYETMFGIRNISYDKKGFLFLNKNKIEIKCYGLYQVGDSVEITMQNKNWKKQIESLKQRKYNTFKISVTPRTIEFLEFCDENGILIIDDYLCDSDTQIEAVLKKNLECQEVISSQKMNQYHQCGESELMNIMLAQKNHPSIIH